jgi:hypothetical protein
LLSKLRTRLTYANVMATIAVFIALGGSSYAAITITGRNVKNSSLTGRDIKNSSLTTSDVKNRSLRAVDFKSKQLPAGPQGPKGDKGDTAQVIGTNVTGAIHGDAGAVLAHSCTPANVDAAGAQVGELPVIAFVGDTPVPEGLTFQLLKVSSPGEITMRFCNPTNADSPAFTNVGVKIITFK